MHIGRIVKANHQILLAVKQALSLWIIINMEDKLVLHCFTSKKALREEES